MPRLWIALLACLPTIASAAPAHPLEWTAFANLSPFAGFDYVADGHGPSSKGIVEVGAGGAVGTHAGRFELGMGLQYDTGDGTHHRLHFIAAPVRAGVAVVRGRRHRLSVRIETGPALGLAPGYGPRPDGLLWTFGMTGALAIAYAVAISEAHAIVVDAGIRFDWLPELNADPDWYLDHGELTHGQAPFVRVGFAWR